jgi:membrane fusion protein, multidrug efflux system
MRKLSLLFLLALPCAAVTVPVASPTTGIIHRWVTVPSRLEANQQTILHAKVGGFLQSIAVDVGDVVKAGQEIAVLEVPELEADRIKAVAEVEVADAELRRLQTAREKAPGLVLPQAIDDADGRQRIAEAGMKRTEVLLGYAKITAPFDGVITARHADPGAYIPAGGTNTEGATVTICDLSVLRARVPVPEQEASFIKPGTLARIVVSPSATPIEAKVSRHGRSVGSGSATLTVEVDVPNSDGKLLSGIYVKTQLAAETHTDALLIPAAALLTEKTSSSVFIVKDGKAVKTKVTPGFNDGKHVEILNGLAGTETIVVLTGLTLTDGQAVSIAK